MTIYLQRTNDHGDPTQVTSSLGKTRTKYPDPVVDRVLL